MPGIVAGLSAYVQHEDVRQVRDVRPEITAVGSC